MTKQYWECGHCGSQNLQIMVWMDLHSEAVIDDCQPQTVYCNDCDTHTKILPSTRRENVDKSEIQSLSTEDRGD